MPSFNQRMGLNRYAADEYYRRALTAFARRDYDRAIGQLNDAIEELPRNAEYYAARGLIHLEEAEYDEAQADFATALECNKVELLANYGMGLLALRRKDPAGAVKYLLAAHYVDAGRPEPLFALGVAHYAQGDMVNATNFMGRANDVFEKRGDKRKAEFARWLRELARHVAKLSRGQGTLPDTRQQALPLGEPPRPPA